MSAIPIVASKPSWADLSPQVQQDELRASLIQQLADLEDEMGIKPSRNTNETTAPPGASSAGQDVVQTKSGKSPRKPKAPKRDEKVPNPSPTSSGNTRKPGRKGKKSGPCLNGDECTYPNCIFTHPRDGALAPKKPSKTTSKSSKTRLISASSKNSSGPVKCKFGANCNRKATCTFDHTVDSDDLGRQRCPAWSKCGNLACKEHTDLFYHPCDTTSVVKASTILTLPPPEPQAVQEDIKVSEISQPVAVLEAPQVSAEMKQKPVCFYHTKGICTKTDKNHLSKYEHPVLQKCRFGSRCTNKSKRHLEGFLHPPNPTNSSEQPVLRKCRYGIECRDYLAVDGNSGNASHVKHCQEFYHGIVPNEISRNTAN